MRVELPRRSLRPVTLLIAVALCVVFIYGPRASAQTPAFIAPQTRLIIFADHRMGDGEWAALLASLRRDLTGSVDGPPLAEDAVLIQGDAIARRLPFQDGIAVYLHGNCALVPPAFYERHVIQGALGWVLQANRRIQPYVHVDCARIVQVLEWPSMHWSQHRRDVVMGEAMARVIVHEWIHYATQNATHIDHGITKPEFSVADLLADDNEFQPHKRVRHQNKAQGL